MQPLSNNYNQFEEDTFTSATPLTDSFLNTFVTELDNDDIVGIILAGSYARGDATQYSDIDLACFVKDSAKLLKRFLYRDGHLVSIVAKRIADVRESMARPNTAIVVVPGFHHAHILLDKDGSVKQFLHEIETFSWHPLQEAANSYASFHMLLLAEWVHKILSEVLRKNASGLSAVLTEFVYNITEIIAVQRGILIKTTSTYYQQVQNHIGQNTDWTHYHRQMIGITPAPTAATPIIAQASAALYLYQATVKLLHPILQPDHLAVAEQTSQLIDEARSHLKL